MTERDEELRRLYAEHRLEHQLAYYRARSAEYAQAATQAHSITVVLMVVAAVAGAASFLGLFGDWVGWSVLSVGAPALVTALAGYEGLYGFERNAKLYDDAASALEELAEAPTQPVGEWIAAAEAVMRREQGRWGQLALEAEPSR